MKNFITSSELYEQSTGYVIIDCRGEMDAPDIGYKAYETSRIPNAFFISFADLYAPSEIHGGRHPLPDMKVFAEKIGKLGISKYSRVVLYDDWIGAGAHGRLWWMLKYIGIDNVRALVGGFKAWTEAGYHVETGIPQAHAISTLITGPLNKEMLVTIDEVPEIIKNHDKVLVDVRQDFRYRGESEPLDRVAGHIPTAVNCYFEDPYTETGLASREVWSTLFAPLAAKGKPVVVYCGSGISAPVGMMAMDEMGLNPALYLGSFSDWISYPENEVATGEEK